MSHLRRLRPSPAMVVAIVAVVFAMAPLAGAASSALSPAKPRHAASHVDYANRAGNARYAAKAGRANVARYAFSTEFAHSVTRAQSASVADSATKAGTATNAGHAARADSAITAQTVNGASFVSWNKTATEGTPAAPTVVTLATIGPFTIVGKCSKNGATTYASTWLRTSMAHSAMDNYSNHDTDQSDFGPTSAGDTTIGITPAVPGDLRVSYGEASGSNGSPGWKGPYDGTFTALSADRATSFEGFAGEAVYLGTAGGADPSAPPCTFMGRTMIG